MATFKKISELEETTERGYAIVSVNGVSKKFNLANLGLSTQFTVLPSASENAGKVFQYIGETNSNYIQGEFYVSKLNGVGQYQWTKLESTSNPDWNAKEGESGYIANRTHYIKEGDILSYDNVSLSLSGGVYVGNIGILEKFSDIHHVTYNGEYYDRYDGAGYVNYFDYYYKSKQNASNIIHLRFYRSDLSCDVRFLFNPQVSSVDIDVVLNGYEKLDERFLPTEQNGVISQVDKNCKIIHVCKTLDLTSVGNEIEIELPSGYCCTPMANGNANVLLVSGFNEDFGTGTFEAKIQAKYYGIGLTGEQSTDEKIVSDSGFYALNFSRVLDGSFAIKVSVTEAATGTSNYKYVTIYGDIICHKKA